MELTTIIDFFLNSLKSSEEHDGIENSTENYTRWISTNGSALFLLRNRLKSIKLESLIILLFSKSILRSSTDDLAYKELEKIGSRVSFYDTSLKELFLPRRIYDSSPTTVMSPSPRSIIVSDSEKDAVFYSRCVNTHKYMLENRVYLILDVVLFKKMLISSFYFGAFNGGVKGNVRDIDQVDVNCWIYFKYLLYDPPRFDSIDNKVYENYLALMKSKYNTLWAVNGIKLVSDLLNYHLNHIYMVVSNSLGLPPYMDSFSSSLKEFYMEVSKLTELVKSVKEDLISDMSIVHSFSIEEYWNANIDKIVNRISLKYKTFILPHVREYKFELTTSFQSIDKVVENYKVVNYRWPPAFTFLTTECESIKKKLMKHLFLEKDIRKRLSSLDAHKLRVVYNDAKLFCKNNMLKFGNLDIVENTLVSKDHQKKLIEIYMDITWLLNLDDFLIDDLVPYYKPSGREVPVWLIIGTIYFSTIDPLIINIAKRFKSNVDSSDFHELQMGKEIDNPKNIFIRIGQVIEDKKVISSLPYLKECIRHVCQNVDSIEGKELTDSLTGLSELCMELINIHPRGKTIRREWSQLEENRLSYFVDVSGVTSSRSIVYYEKVKPVALDQHDKKVFLINREKKVEKTINDHLTINGKISLSASVIPTFSPESVKKKWNPFDSDRLIQLYQNGSFDYRHRRFMIKGSRFNIMLVVYDISATQDTKEFSSFWFNKGEIQDVFGYSITLTKDEIYNILYFLENRIHPLVPVMSFNEYVKEEPIENVNEDQFIDPHLSKKEKLKLKKEIKKSDYSIQKLNVSALRWIYFLSRCVQLDIGLTFRQISFIVPVIHKFYPEDKKFTIIPDWCPVSFQKLDKETEVKVILKEKKFESVPEVSVSLYFALDWIKDDKSSLLARKYNISFKSEKDRSTAHRVWSGVGRAKSGIDKKRSADYRFIKAVTMKDDQLDLLSCPYIGELSTFLDRNFFYYEYCSMYISQRFIELGPELRLEICALTTSGLSLYKKIREKGLSIDHFVIMDERENSQQLNKKNEINANEKPIDKNEDTIDILRDLYMLFVFGSDKADFSKLIQKQDSKKIVSMLLAFSEVNTIDVRNHYRRDMIWISRIFHFGESDYNKMDFIIPPWVIRELHRNSNKEFPFDYGNTIKVLSSLRDAISIPSEYEFENINDLSLTKLLDTSKMRQNKDSTVGLDYSVFIIVEYLYMMNKCILVMEKMKKENIINESQKLFAANFVAVCSNKIRMGFSSVRIKNIPSKLFVGEPIDFSVSLEKSEESNLLLTCVTYLVSQLNALSNLFKSENYNRILSKSLVKNKKDQITLCQFLLWKMSESLNGTKSDAYEYNYQIPRVYKPLSDYYERMEIADIKLNLEVEEDLFYLIHYKLEKDELKNGGLSIIAKYIDYIRSDTLFITEKLLERCKYDNL